MSNINAVNTASIRSELSRQIEHSGRVSHMLATGNAIQRAYQDPSGLVIGSNIKSSHDNLSTVTKGIEHGQSMLYIAEDGLKHAIHATKKMQKILTKAQGLTSDELISTSLAPEYNQLKSEINRIADQTHFNGQNLLNCSGGSTQSSGTSGTLGGITEYNFDDAITNIAAPTGTVSVTGTISGGGNVSTIALSGGTRSITGGTMSINNGTTVISGATLTINDAIYSSNNTNTGTVNTSMLVNITFPTLSANGTVSGTPTIALNSNPGFTFSNWNKTAGATIHGITNITANTASLTGAASTITNVVGKANVSGGVGASSTFNFVISSDLVSVLKVKFPNIKLNDSNGIKGVISTLNPIGIQGTTAPTALTNLQNTSDVDTDIPLVNALHKYLVEQRVQIGAYESRFSSIHCHLTDHLDGLDIGCSNILNTDFAEASEWFSRTNVQISVIVALLKKMNQVHENLAMLVT